MKKLIHLSIVAAALALPFAASAKDSDKNKDKYRSEDYYREQNKQLRNDVRNLQKHYDRVRDQMKNSPATRSQWDQFKSIGSDVDRVSWQFERGNTDPRYIRDQVRRLDYSLTRLSQQLSQNRPRGYSRY